MPFKSLEIINSTALWALVIVLVSLFSCKKPAVNTNTDGVGVSILRDVEVLDVVVRLEPIGPVSVLGCCRANFLMLDDSLAQEFNCKRFVFEVSIPDSILDTYASYLRYQVSFGFKVNRDWCQDCVISNPIPGSPIDTGITEDI